MGLYHSAAQQEEIGRAVDKVQRENQRQQEERWSVREVAAEKIRQTVRRAEGDTETWLRDTLELEREEG